MLRGLMQAAAALAGAGWTVVACYATGAILAGPLGIRKHLRRLEQIPLLFVLGASILHLLLFAIFAAHLAYRPVLIVVMAAILLWALRSGGFRLQGEASDPLPRPLIAIAGLCFAVYFVFDFVNAWAPEASPDGSSYHLGLIFRYLRAHGFERVTTNMYAALSGGVDLLFAPAFDLGKHSAGALVHFSFLVALAWMLLAFGCRLSRPWVGAAAAIFTFLSPVIGKDGTSAYVDLAVAAVVFSVFYFLELWDASRDARLLIPVGLLCGYAYAAKYTAFVIVIYAAGFLWIRARSLRPVITVVALSLVMIAPWVIRNWLWYANPVAPVENDWFRNANFHIAAEKTWAANLRMYGLTSRWQIPMEVIWRGAATGGALGPLFFLLPVALLALRHSTGRRLLTAAVIMLLPYPANIGTRFLIPAVPFLTLALAWPLSSPVLLAAMMIANAIVCWPTVIREYAPASWRILHFPWRAALRIETQDGYLRRVWPDYGIARMIEDHVPAGQSVLALTGTSDAYTTREIRVAYESASNQNLAETLEMGWSAGTQPLRAWSFPVSEQRARRIRVLQTAQAQDPEQWNVHEFRVFDHGRELPRSSEWRILSWPNPYDASFAFDHSPVTRWRSWETAAPGMYIQLDFGRETAFDEVRLDTSPDYIRARFVLQVEDPAGTWQTISSMPVESVLPEPKQVRREATHELALRGVHYVLVRDTDFGAEDYANDPEGWGFEIAAQGYGATLYRTLW